MKNQLLRELLGKRVRSVWVQWARTQPNPKPSWLVPWDRLGEPDREVDRLIGEELYRMGWVARELADVPVMPALPPELRD